METRADVLSGAFEHSAQPSEIPHQGSSALDKLLKTDSVDPVAAAKDLQIALKLHDDIYEVCRQKKVDRFSKYKVEDNLAQTAMQRIRSREGKRFPARFSIGYWKAWTETRDTLEHTSEQVKRSEEAAELLAGRRRPSKMPFKSTYKKPKKNPRDKLRGLAFGPPNAQMPSMYVQADPCGQPPVAALFEEHTNRPLPKDPTMLPKPVFVPPFKGGDIPAGQPRPAPARSVTSQCDMKTAEELLGPFFKKPISFTSAARFKGDRGGSRIGAYSGLEEPNTQDYQGRFGKEERLAGPNLHDVLHATPSPFEYTVLGEFDKTRVEEPEEVKAQRLRTLKQQRALRDSSATQLARIATFGFGCSMEEHRKYGLCLDGMCGRRGRTEDVILLCNSDALFRGQLDESRLKHPKGNQDRKFSSPMQAAIISGDFERVTTLVDLGYNINEIDPVSKRAAIHEAVIRGYVALVSNLCKAYAVPSPDHPVHLSPPPVANTTGHPSDPAELKAILDAAMDDLSIGSNTSLGEDILGIYTKKRDDRVMRLDLMDSAGDTVFHYCARLGHQEILETLCDHAVMLVDSPNNKGDYPSDIAKNHVLFQLISIANDRIKLENQLRELKKEKRRMTKGTSGSVGSRIGMISPTESRASSRGASRSTSGARAEPLRESSTAAESDDSDEDDDNFDHLSKTTEGTETSGSLSLQNHTLDKDKLFAKYRRHSFRVGYFDEEDKERAGTGRQGSEGPHSQLNCAT